MKSSESIDKISEALSLAQAEYQPVLKKKTNPFFKNSKYADLAAIFDATREALAKYGLAIIQSPLFQDGRVILTTRLLHKSGQWFETDLSLKPTADTPQAVGSAITYNRRYSVAPMLGVAEEDDDDGHAATHEGQSDNCAPIASEGKVNDKAIKSQMNAFITKPSAEIPPSVTFDMTNLKHIEYLEKKLNEIGIGSEMHDEIAIDFNGKAFKKDVLDTCIADYRASRGI